MNFQQKPVLNMEKYLQILKQTKRLRKQLRKKEFGDWVQKQK